MAKKKVFDEHGNEVKAKIKKPFYKKIWFWALVVIIIIVANLGGDSDDTATESDDSTQEVASEPLTDTEEVTSTEEAVQVTLNIDNEEVEADEERNAIITGTTNPGATVSVGFGIIGDSVEADQDGKFTLEHSISEDLDNEEITINAIVDSESDSKDVNIKQNPKVLTLREEREAAEAEEAAKAAEAEEAAEVEEAAKATEAEAEEENVSREFSNARQTAIDYLNYTPFSKEGLYEQLLFEQFPEDAARYAVDNIDVDWNSQAHAKAVEYLDYSSFSDSGLYDQLIYEKFTAEQAQYAIDNLE